jgi:hypothetical protein
MVEMVLDWMVATFKLGLCSWRLTAASLSSVTGTNDKRGYNIRWHCRRLHTPDGNLPLQGWRVNVAAWEFVIG